MQIMEGTIIADIFSKGCSSRREASIVKQIYQELVEVKRYWDVEYFYHDVHKRMYISAKISKTQKPSLFIPNHVSNCMDFLQMQHFSSMNSDGKYESIYFAFLNADSSCVCYRISGGHVEPKQITSKHLVRNKQKIRDVLMRKNRNLLEQSALYGIPITLTLNADAGSSNCSKT